MSYGRDVQKELQGPAAALRKAIPDVYAGYRQLHSAVFRSGALDLKTKELIALALSVGNQCDGCIAAHARGAARNGATAEEVAEAIGVSIALGGGPGTVYGPRAFAAYQEFAESEAPRATAAAQE